MLSSSLLHRLHHLSQDKCLRSLTSREALEARQRRRFARILAAAKASARGSGALGKVSTYEDFAAALQPTSYADWQSSIERQRLGGRPELCQDVRRYVPTSGSTESVKWIPYNAAFLKEIQAAAGAWISDISRRYPKTLGGKHYWSLSWLPDSHRKQGTSNDDSRFLSHLTRMLHAACMAVPKETTLLKSCHDSLFASAAYLAATPDLRLMSVWSPSFALELMRILSERREELAAILAGARWHLDLPAKRNTRAASLFRAWDGKLEPEFFRELWPELALVSAWDSSTSAQWAEQLKTLFPHAVFQGKGLWATEGVVTIPIRGEFVLAADSHFYEFRVLGTGEILPSWQLEKGLLVSPILSAGNGLMRYQLGDRMRCTGFAGALPTLEFVGRMGGVDMVGEKLDRGVVAHILAKQRADGAPVISLVGRKAAETPRYELLMRRCEPLLAEGTAAAVEKELRANFHYDLARDLGQLSAVTSRNSADPLADYRGYFPSKIQGNIKIEELVLAEA